MAFPSDKNVTRDVDGNIGGVLPTLPQHLTTKAYVDAQTGGVGKAGIEYTQSTPAASWTIPTAALARHASVSVWVGGEEVETDVTQDANYVYIVFPSPKSGFAIVN